MTMKFASAMFLLCAAQKRANFETPLLAKDPWKIVDEFVPVQMKPKFFALHRNFGQLSGRYENLIDQIRKSFFMQEIEWPKWLFFKDLESEKIIAENVDKRYKYWTALHCVANGRDTDVDVEVAKALIEAGVDVNAQDHDKYTALHIAAMRSNVKIGKLLIEAGASLELRSLFKGTALDIVVRYRYKEFADMLRTKQK